MLYIIIISIVTGCITPTCRDSNVPLRTLITQEVYDDPSVLGYSADHTFEIDLSRRLVTHYSDTTFYDCEVNDNSAFPVVDGTTAYNDVCVGESRILDSDSVITQFRNGAVYDDTTLIEFNMVSSLFLYKDNLFSLLLDDGTDTGLQIPTIARERGVCGVFGVASFVLCDCSVIAENGIAPAAFTFTGANCEMSTVYNSTDDIIPVIIERITGSIAVFTQNSVIPVIWGQTHVTNVNVIAAILTITNDTHKSIDVAMSNNTIITHAWTTCFDGTGSHNYTLIPTIGNYTDYDFECDIACTSDCAEGVIGPDEISTLNEDVCLIGTYSENHDISLYYGENITCINVTVCPDLIQTDPTTTTDRVCTDHSLCATSIETGWRSGCTHLCPIGNVARFDDGVWQGICDSVPICSNTEQLWANLNLCLSPTDFNCIVNNIDCHCHEFPLEYRNLNTCVNVTTCDYDIEYEQTIPTPTTDRVCTPITPMCSGGKGYLDDPTNTTAGLCSNCSATFWYDRSNAFCFPCTVCPAVTQVECGVDNDAVCGVCPDPDQHVSAFDNGKCVDNTKCPVGQFISHPATTTSDVICVMCTATCPAGFRHIKGTCNGTHDSMCTPCPPFHYIEADSEHSSPFCVPDTVTCANANRSAVRKTLCHATFNNFLENDRKMVSIWVLGPVTGFLATYPPGSVFFNYGHTIRSSKIAITGLLFILAATGAGVMLAMRISFS